MAGKTITPRILSLALVCSAAAADVQRFHLSQTWVALPDLTAYLNIHDAAGSAVADAPSNRLHGSLGGRPLNVISLTPFEKTSEGVAYIFVVDTSESIAPARFETIRASIESWVGASEPKDRLAIIEFAEAVHVLSDFTDGKEKTLAAAHKLARSGKKSLVHQAIVEAVELSSRRDAGLPTRRVIVVVTDGKDEGSGLKSDDVVERALASNVPVYAIGYSNLRAEERRQYLDELHRISEKTGGEYSEVEANGLTDAFVGMKKAIRRVSVAKFSCPTCVADSKKARLEVQFEAGTRVFTDGFNVLAVARPATPNTPVVKPPWWKRPWWVYACAALVPILLGGGLWLALARRKKRQEKIAAEKALSSMPPAVSPIDLSMNAYLPPDVAPGNSRRPSVVVRFTVIRGHQRGTVSELPMETPRGGFPSIDGSEARLVIGRRYTANLPVSDDETVSSEHCELVWMNRKLVIRDLRSSNGTLVNGVPIVGDQPLEDGDRVGIGQTEYRVEVASNSL